MNRTEYKRYLHSPHWQELRRQVFERALQNAGSTNLHGVCERCGYEPWRPCLQLHHISYDRVGAERLEDLILLCPNCHREETRKQKEAKNQVS